jgi:hypothetical protein
MDGNSARASNHQALDSPPCSQTAGIDYSTQIQTQEISISFLTSS